MRRMTYFVMALALVLGFTQCKKEQPLEPTNDGNGVRITLNVENGSNSGSRVNVTDNHVTFQSGDQILVGYNGAYVGTLTHNGEHFAGSIDATVTGSQKLYFYFVGNKNKTGASISVGAESYTVDISDQTTELPVLSFSASIEDFTGAGSYSASLHNQCALVKFPLTNAAGSVCVSGMCTEATISFASPSITKTGVTGTVRLHSVSDTEKWAILLPQNEIATNVVIGGTEIPVTVPEIIANRYVTSIDEIDNSSVSSLVDLSKLYDHYTAKDGDILTGELIGASQPYKIAIADGATVTLDNVNIEGESRYNYSWAGITCEGDATIILKDGSTNTVKGFYKNYPGIFAAVGHTLIIKGGAEGTGKLNASSNGEGAGIGGGSNNSCGNIEIQGGVITATGSEGGAGIGGGMEADCGAITITGGTVTATGGSEAAGIGSGGEASCGAITITGGTVTATGVYEGGAGIGSGIYGASCGAITITGGTVTATGGSSSAGIGSGFYASCDNITITNGVTQVTATKGDGAPNSIGAGDGDSSCGTVTIGCTLDGDGNPVGGQTGAVTTSPLVYPTPETITWTSLDLYDVRLGLGYPHTDQTIKRITATISSGGCWDVDLIDGTVEFSSSTYTTFKNIEITCSEPEGVPLGWSYGDHKLTWTGSSSRVSMTTLGESIGGISQIVFTVQ